MHNYKPGIKIVSVLQRLQGEIGRKISDVQKRDEQTDKQTNGQTSEGLEAPATPRDAASGETGAVVVDCCSGWGCVEWEGIAPDATTAALLQHFHH